jgi:rare lipoprotein A
MQGDKALLVLTPVPPAAQTLSPVGITSATSAALLAPSKTSLTVRRAQLNVLEGQSATIAGTLADGHHKRLSRRVIVLQSLGNHGWRSVAQARTNARGLFRFHYTARGLGSQLVRVRFAGDPFDLPSRKRLGRLNVYREVGASWYGGGGSLACGGSLTGSTLGVANKTLPCGTIVTLRYGGHTVRVPVIDRGPYVEGREFDLTEATKAALGFGDTGQIWSTR